MTKTLDNQQIAARFYGRGKIHRALQSPQEFGEEHLAQYRELGFVAIENVFSREEIESAKKSLRHLIAGDNPNFDNVDFEPGVDVEKLPPHERERYVRKLMFFIEHDAVLNALSQHPTLLSIVRRLAGEDVRMAQDMALLKQAHVGTEKPWHQDTAYFLLEPPEKVIGTWTALDDATLDNGCMHVVPGSQLDGPKPHYHERDCQLPDDETRAAKDVAVPLSPGGVLFFSGLLHHGTPPNNSPSSRWALQFHYAALSCRPIEVSTHEKDFHDANGYAACAGWSIGEKPRPMPESLRATAS